MEAVETGKKRKKFSLSDKDKKQMQEEYRERTLKEIDGSENKIKLQSSLMDHDVNSGREYMPMISWGEYNLKEIINKMMQFSEFLTGITLYPYQKEFQFRIFESILKNDGEEITALFSRQGGKTETIACSCATLMVLIPTLAKVFPKQLGHYSQGFWVGLFAPSSEQAYTTHERMDIRLDSDQSIEVLGDPDIHATKKYKGGMITLSGKGWKSFCRLQTAAVNAKVESKTYHLAIIEEAQDVDSMKVLKSIHPMVSAVNGTIVKVGTPTNRLCEFFEAIKRNRIYQTQSRVQNHFEYNYKIVQKYNKRYRAFIEKEKDRLGEESDAFLMAFELVWMLEKGMALTPGQFEEYMRDVSMRFDYGTEDEVYVAGLDLGKARDSTVLTILRVENIYEDTRNRKVIRKKCIANWLELTGENWESQFDQIYSTLQNYNVHILFVDSTGKGDPVVDRLVKAFSHTSIDIQGIIFTEKSKNEMALLFYEEMRAHRIAVPSHAIARKTRRYKNFMSQWFNVEKHYRKKMMYFEHSKERGARDDYVDSLLLALQASQDVSTNRPISYARNILREGNTGHSSRYDKAMERLRARQPNSFRNRRNIAKFGKGVEF